MKIRKISIILFAFLMFSTAKINAEEEDLKKPKIETEKKKEDKRTSLDFLKDSKVIDKDSKINSTITNGSNLPKLPLDLEPTKKTDSKINLKSSVDENGNKVVPKEKIQFLPVETKNGIKFNIIIDYTKSSKNVKFLTESTETDMLNVISQKEKIEAEKKKQEEQEATDRKQKEQEVADKKVQEEKSKKEKEKNLIFIIIKIIIVSIILIILGFFWKKYYPNIKSIIKSKMNKNKLSEGD